MQEYIKLKKSISQNSKFTGDLMEDMVAIISKTPINELRDTDRRVALFAFISYLLIIYLFAIGYLFFGNFIPRPFNKYPIDFIDAFFLSFTSISVGPSGIEANSILTKLLILIEVAIGLIYTVLVFSIIASFMMQHRNEADGKDGEE